MTTVGTSTTMDPTQDPRYLALAADYDAQIDAADDNQTPIKNRMAELAQQDPRCTMSDQQCDRNWLHYWSPQSVEYDQLANVLQQAQQYDDQKIKDLQSAKADALQSLAANLQGTADAAQMLADADKAGQDMAVDFSGKNLDEVIMLIMGATNNATDSIARSIANDLAAQNKQIGQLNSLLNALRAKVPSGTGNDTVSIDPSVIKQLNDLGVSTDGSVTYNDKSKMDEMKKDQLQALLENIKTQTETLSNNQTAELQALTKANNNHNERSDMISHVIDTLHETNNNALR